MQLSVFQRDKYFTIRYRMDGRTVEEPLGWSSEGMTEERANETLAAIKRRIRDGSDVRSLKDKRLTESSEEDPY